MTRTPILLANVLVIALLVFPQMRLTPAVASGRLPQPGITELAVTPFEVYPPGSIVGGKTIGRERRPSRRFLPGKLFRARRNPR